MKVTEIMSRQVVSVTESMPVKEAARLLAKHGISALPVLDLRGNLAGIVSEADLVVMQFPPSAQSKVPTVGEVMTRRVISVRTQSEVSQAARVMLDSGIKHVPVVEGKRVVGIVSRRDLMRVLARREEWPRREAHARSRR